ncbi:MAG: extracellular solute-binding protein [Butyrivibrio sp.]|nr:extracellular solute-binding protein [Butyrivibrio sp.]
MKRIYLKRCLALTMAGIMCVSAAACGKKSSGSDDATTHDSKNFVYKENDISLGEGVDTSSINKLGAFGDKLFAVGYNYGEESIDTVVYTFNKDGSDVQANTIKADISANIIDVALAEDGSIFDAEVEYAGSSFMNGDEIDFSNLFGDDVEVVPADETGSDSGAEEATLPIDSDDSESTSEDSEMTSDDSEDMESDKAEKPAPTPVMDVAEVADDELSEEVETPEEATEQMNETAEETESTTEAQEAIDSLTGGEQDKYSLVKRHADGTEEWKVEIPYDADTYYYISSLEVIDGKGIFISDPSGIHQYSIEDGSLVKDFDLEGLATDENSDFSITVYKMHDGNLAGVYNDGETNSFYKIDVDAGTVSAVEGAHVEAYEYQLFAGNPYDFFAVNSEGVYGYNMGDETPTQLLNFVDSDIDASGLYQLIAISETEMFALLPSDDMGFILSILTKVNPEDVKDKQIITLGCNYIDYDVRSHVVKFNKENENYRIVITDYSNYETDDDMSAGANKLNTDIVSSNAPDILVLDNDMPVDSYIAKGLFEDMSDYFNNDEELSKKQFIEAMNVFKNDGKMYKLVPAFSIETVVAAKKYAGDDNDYTWSIDELEKMAKDTGVEYKNIFGTLSREEVFDMALTLAGSQFIDWENLKCSYDSDAFIHLLEFINEFPVELKEEDYETDTSAYWREGLSLAERIYLTSFSDYNYAKKGVFGEDISFVGFPSDNASGSCITPTLQLTMSANSKVKDGCWEFMRYFLTDEYQNTIDGNWPVSMDKINELAAAAKKKPVYIDEDGKEQEYDDTYYIGESEIIIDPMTDDEVNAVIDYINSVTQVGSYNDSVLNIIQEESEAFFSGQKSAKEVADIIQSRVQIYVNEIS